jgi:hypothetical protein
MNREVFDHVGVSPKGRIEHRRAKQLRLLQNVRELDFSKSSWGRMIQGAGCPRVQPIGRDSSPFETGKRADEDREQNGRDLGPRRNAPD